nr:reverse transcriptase domain, reverse transcriptase zinc-binding domain protein [Tanacetum cinerariifolium]
MMRSSLVNGLVIILKAWLLSLNVSTVSGLKINFHKSQLLGVGVSPSEVSSFAALTGCNPLITPFTYLGLPIDCNMARIKSWDLIVEKFSKRLSNWRASLLSLFFRILFRPSPNDFEDSWAWTVGGHSFSVSSARHLIDSRLLPEQGPATRWCNIIPKKINIFVWRVLRDRLPTRWNLSRQGIELNSLNCPICDTRTESTFHTIWVCSLASLVWNRIFRWLDLHIPSISHLTGLLSWIDDMQLPHIKKKILEVICNTCLWSLWHFRNETVFGIDTPKRSLIFDKIVDLSYRWFSARYSAFGRHLEEIHVTWSYLEKKQTRLRVANIQVVGHDVENKESGDAAMADQVEESNHVVQDEGDNIVADEEIEVTISGKPKGSRKKRKSAKGVSGSNLPLKKLRADHGTSSADASTGRKFVAALQSLLEHNTFLVEVGVTVVATVLFVTSSVSLTLERDTNDAGTEVSSVIMSLIPDPPILTTAVATTVVDDTSILVPRAGNEQVYHTLFADSTSMDEANPDVVGPSHPAGIELSMDSFHVKKMPQLSLKEVEAAEAIRLRSQIATVEAVKATRASELDSLKERIPTLEGQVVALESTIVIKDTELASSNAQITKLTQVLSNFQLSCDELSIKAASLEYEKDKLTDQVSMLESTCFGLRDEVLGMPISAGIAAFILYVSENGMSLLLDLIMVRCALKTCGISSIQSLLLSSSRAFIPSPKILFTLSTKPLACGCLTEA